MNARLYCLVGLQIIASLASCKKVEDKMGLLAPVFNDGNQPKVISSVPAPGSVGLASSQNVAIFFNKTVDSQKCTKAFSIAPNVSGVTQVFGSVLNFAPGQTMATGTYNATLTTVCEDLEGRDLESQYNISFAVGALSLSPTVVAVGLESQSGCTSGASVGSATGGNWTMSSCWWDQSLPILNPSSYQFRGGDTGTGAVGLPNDCADVNTDNFRLIFNNYMNPTPTVNAVSLTRISPPATSIKIASYSWSDCQGVAPYGCRVLTVAFAEDLASCEGQFAFGNTFGDFNLAASAGGPANFPYYILSVDMTARDATGRTPISAFNFAVEGN